MPVQNSSVADFEVSVIEPGIVLNRVVAPILVEEKHIREFIRENERMAEGRTYSVIVDSNPDATITDAARKVTANTSFTPNRKALAIIATSTAHRLVANFFIRFNKPATPTKVFATRDAAIAWIKSLDQKV